MSLDPAQSETVDPLLIQKYARLDNLKQKKFQKAAIDAARSEILLEDQAGSFMRESESPLSQQNILEQVDLQSAAKSFDLSLEMGEYVSDFSRNGRYLLLGGRKGHVAMMDWPAQRLMCELQLAETVRDVKFLHNHLMFAVAQKDSVFIYDQSGIELHCLKHHSVPFFLDFLPYHFLLVAIGRDNVLRYQDTSTGARVVDHKVKKLGPAQCMRQNPKNAVITLGHQRGLVSMWTPNMADPVVKLLAHPGPVLSLCFDHSNANTMITCGADRTVKIWDLRTYKSLAEKKLQSPCESVDASMTGLIAFGRGNNVQVWNSSDIISSESEFLKNPLVQTRYLSDKVSRVRFCPYEDVLGVSRQNGYSSVLVPGAGEVNYDSGEINPFETKKQRQEREVKELLEKLRPEMITLDEGKSIGAVGDAAMFAEAGSEILNGASKLAPLKKLRRKQRGRNSSHKRFMRSKLSQSSKSSSESRKLSNRADSELLKSAALSRFI